MNPSKVGIFVGQDEINLYFVFPTKRRPFDCTLEFLEVKMIKQFSVMFLVFVSVQSYAKSLTTGRYTLAGPRSCMNGAAIEDSGFTENVSEYTFNIGEGTLQISMKYQGNPVLMEYAWTDLNSERIQVSPITQGSNQFQISQEGQKLTAFFEDRTGKFCGGGQIATPMKLIQ